MGINAHIFLKQTRVSGEGNAHRLTNPLAPFVRAIIIVADLDSIFSSTFYKPTLRYKHSLYSQNTQFLSILMRAELA